MRTHFQESNHSHTQVKSTKIGNTSQRIISLILALSIIFFVLIIICYGLHLISRIWFGILIVFVTILDMFMLYLLLFFFDVPNIARLFSNSPFSRRKTLQQLILQHKPTPLLSVKTYHQIVGVPPSTNSKVIQEREKVVKEVYALLSHPNTSVVALTGLAGTGKSTLAAMICSYINKHADNLFVAKPLWLSIKSDTTLSDLIATIFKSLGRPLPSIDSMSAGNHAKLLFEAMNSSRNTVFVILDQLDNLLDPQTGHINTKDSGISEWLDIIGKQKSVSRLLLTCRSVPGEVNKNLGHYAHTYLVKGLDDADGVEFLRRQNINAVNSELYQVVKYCYGHPQALSSFVSIFHRYSPTNITEFLEDGIFTKLWALDLAHNLLDPIYKEQLNEEERKLILAFSIYREPVPLEAPLKLIADVQHEKVQAALKVLKRQHVLQEFGDDHYQIHPILLDYLWDKFDESDEKLNSEARCTAHWNASQYYLNQITFDYPPAGQRREFRYLHPLIEAVWHQCQGNYYQEAFHLMDHEKIFSDLLYLGRSDILLELYQLLFPLQKWNPTQAQKIHLYENLGKIYSDLGEKEKAAGCFEQALNLVRISEDFKEEGKILNDLGRSFSALGEKEEAKSLLEYALQLIQRERDHTEEAVILNNLGLVYDDLGYRTIAKEYLEKALSLSIEMGNSLEESRIINSLGQIYADLGEKEQAILLFERAREIRQKLKDRRGEGITLSNLGQVYADLGKYSDAVRYCQQGLYLSKEVKDRWGQGKALRTLGQVYCDLGIYDDAIRYFEQSLILFQEVKDRWGQVRVLIGLIHTHNLLGQKVKAREYYKEALKISREAKDRKGEGRILNLIINNLELADNDSFESKEVWKQLEQALQLCREVDDKKGEAWTLNNLGRIYFTLGNKKESKKYYDQALELRIKVCDLRGTGWTLFNLGMLHLEQGHYQSALMSLLKAKKIFIGIKSQDVSKVQLAIDNLHKEIGEQRFNTLLKKVESKVE